MKGAKVLEKTVCRLTPCISGQTLNEIVVQTTSPFYEFD